jgi:hypothetical protein
LKLTFHHHCHNIIYKPFKKNVFQLPHNTPGTCFKTMGYIFIKYFNKQIGLKKKILVKELSIFSSLLFLTLFYLDI